MPFDAADYDTRTARLNRLAEFFDEGAEGYNLNMSVGFRFPTGKLESSLEAPCGTTGCIAGYAMAMAFQEGAHMDRSYAVYHSAKQSDVSWGIVRTKAQKYLGLTWSEAEDLFEGFGDRRKIGPAEAAVAIRNVMAGKAAWS